MPFPLFSVSIPLDDDRPLPNLIDMNLSRAPRKCYISAAVAARLTMRRPMNTTSSGPNTSRSSSPASLVDRWDDMPLEAPSSFRALIEEESITLCPR